ncbi:MAG: ATP phosphoribosyltransferase regulatory subunit [Eubacteriales bacterium]
MTLDFLPQTEQIALLLQDMYSRFGYKRYKINKFEEYSFYMEKEQFLNDSRILTFSGPNGKLLALKPDITMSVAKNAMKNPDEDSKIYYHESVFRIPKGDDQFKEISQLGVEFMGDLSDYQLLEVVNLACKSLQTMSSDSRLCLSHAGLILTVMQELSLTSGQRGVVFNLIKQKNLHDLSAFFKQEQIVDGGILHALLTLNATVDQSMTTLRQLLPEPVYQKSLDELALVMEHIGEMINPSHVFLDFSHISCTEYYNGIIFAGYVPGLAVPALLGGRYDKLLDSMGLEGKSALGFAIYLSAMHNLFPIGSEPTRTTISESSGSISELIATSNRLYHEGEQFQINK